MRQEQSSPLSKYTQGKICEIAQEDISLTVVDLAQRFGCTARQAQMALRRNGISPKERARNRPRLDTRGKRKNGRASESRRASK